MNKDAVKYLANNISNQPLKVDRLIVTTFLRANDITVKNNKFLRTLLISETEKSEYKKSVEFLSLVKDNGGKFNLENVIELFEFVLSPSDRIISGAVYTPKEIREYIVDEVFDSYKSSHDVIRIADISSGCGGFLLSAVQKFRSLGKRSFADIFKTNIFGLDIQDYSVTRTEILLTLLAVSNGEDIDKFDFNLFTGDALEFKWQDHVPKFLGFSAVIGNPPYVCSRNIAPRTKKLLVNWSVSNSGHPDLYIPFFQIGIENLAVGGVLGFITMNSFFKSLNGRAVREYFQSKTLKFKILDFGTEQVFESRNTYTCICIIKNEVGKGIQYKQVDKSELHRNNIFKVVDYKSLNFTTGWNLQNNDIISKIESTGTPFGSLYKTRNGIATLKNNVYIFTPIKEDKLYYHLSDEYKIEKGICVDIVNPNKLVSVSDLKSLKEKIIFPYEYVGGKPTIYSEVHLYRNFPQALRYLRSKREILSKRDKGKGKYEKWFAFGRNQSLDKMKHKLFFPHITDCIPNYVINSDEDLLFYNGIAIVGSTSKELLLIRRIMQSRLFWYYITNSSKPYSASFYSLSKNYIKNFGIYKFSESETTFLLNETSQNKVDRFIEDKYQVDLN